MSEAPGLAPAAPAARILTVDARVPTPDRDSGSLRLVNLLGMFRRHTAGVDLVASFSGSFPPFSASLTADTARLRERGIRVIGDRSVEEHLEAHGGEYDLVWICGAYVASRHLPSVRRYAPSAALVYDTIDLHHLREYREAKLSGSVPALRNALAVKRVELAAARAADCTVVVSESERQILLREVPGAATAVVPTVHTVAHAVSGPSGRRGLVYLGAFTFSPNVDAVRWFADAVLPAVRHRLPGVRLVVAGADPTPEVLALAGADVEVTGYVADLEALLARCRVLVAPLRFGAGIKGKLLLAMGQGLPVVASAVAAEGLPATPGIHLAIADSPAEWVEAIAAPYQDADLWLRRSEAGRALVEAHYSPAVVERLVAALLSALLAGRGVGAGGRRSR